MSDIIWMGVKIYFAMGIAFVILTAWYDYKCLADTNYVLSEEEKNIQKDLDAWPLHKIIIDMVGGYLVAVLMWPRYAYLLWEELQYEKM